jgi:hypothetical protein
VKIYIIKKTKSSITRLIPIKTLLNRLSSNKKTKVLERYSKSRIKWPIAYSRLLLGRDTGPKKQKQLSNLFHKNILKAANLKQETICQSLA